ncbi:hypothetical protein Q5752_000713 [Cryptotrichosporon argae]
MSVKFTPGPHPAGKPRYASPYPISNEPSASEPCSGPASPTALTSSPQQLSFSTRGRVIDDGIARRGSRRDPERQPLLAPVELRVARITYPIVIAVLVVVLLVIVGIGGWRLGKGAGGGRWPGGPG